MNRCSMPNHKLRASQIITVYKRIPRPLPGPAAAPSLEFQVQIADQKTPTLRDAPDYRSILRPRAPPCLPHRLPHRNTCKAFELLEFLAGDAQSAGRAPHGRGRPLRGLSGAPGTPRGGFPDLPFSPDLQFHWSVKCPPRSAKKSTNVASKAQCDVGINPAGPKLTLPRGAQKRPQRPV